MYSATSGNCNFHSAVRQKLGPVINVTATHETCCVVRFTECSSTNLDLVFVVDASTKSDPSGWSQLLSFVSNAARFYQISSNGVRVALVQYADRALTSIQFGRYNDANSFGSAVSRIGQLGGGSNLQTGLDQARSVLSGSGSRSKVAIIVTDQFRSSSAISTAAATAVNSGILLVGVGVSGAAGLFLDSSAFQSLLQNRVVIANGYTGLGGVVSQAVSQACPAQATRKPSSFKTFRTKKSNLFIFTCVVAIPTGFFI